MVLVLLKVTVAAWDGVNARQCSVKAQSNCAPTLEFGKLGVALPWIRS